MPGWREVRMLVANNDLNLSSILTDGALITGVVDWEATGSA
jgi:hypothetical protein